MGCDIHARAEKHVGGCWVPVHFMPDAIETLNYDMFGFLAGVRNYSAVTPIAERRGLPQDASAEVREDYDDCKPEAHSPSWLTLEELLSFNYDQPMEDRRTTRKMGPNGVNGACTADPGGGELTTYREFLGEHFLKALEELKAVGAERVVFWFDH